MLRYICDKGTSYVGQKGYGIVGSEHHPWGVVSLFRIVESSIAWKLDCNPSKSYRHPNANIVQNPSLLQAERQPTQMRNAVSVPVTATRAHQPRQVSALNQNVSILDAGTFA